MKASIPKRSELMFTDKYSRERLRGLRQRGDPCADAVVEELQRQKGLTNIYDLYGAVVERAKAKPNGEGPFSAFLQESSRTPDWVDRAQGGCWFYLLCMLPLHTDTGEVERGQRVQAIYSQPMGPSLFAGSLVGGSMFKSAALVTAMAGNLGGTLSTLHCVFSALVVAYPACRLSLKPKIQSGGRKRLL